MNFKTALKFLAIFGMVVAVALVVYDVLFSKPLIMQGIIVEKVYMPHENNSAQNVLPYSKYKSRDYMVTAQQHEQWVAFVKLEDDQILKVHCHTDHFGQKQIGDTLHFKEYTGELFGIDYFAHNEEDEELENALQAN
jgi:hypothetical protein